MDIDFSNVSLISIHNVYWHKVTIHKYISVVDPGYFKGQKRNLMNDPRPLIINASVTEIFDDGITRAIVSSSILIQSCVIVISVHLCLVFLM